MPNPFVGREPLLGLIRASAGSDGGGAYPVAVALPARIYSTGQDCRPETLEVAVDVHALVQYAHDIDDAVGRDSVIQGV